MQCQYFWDIAKALFRGKFIVLNTYSSKEETSKINNLSFDLRKVEKEEFKPTLAH